VSFRKGFLLGKFMPPHNGHLHLIDSAAAQCDDLVVLVCTLERDPIPGQLRFRWVQELRGEHTIVHVTEDVPASPDEHPAFWSIWEDLLRRWLPANIEVVFSSEDYGDEIARRLGIRHVMVDRARATVPVSGAQIRADPFRYWDYIPHPVRPFFVSRVAILGPESCGKSVLARTLAEQFSTTFVAEYGREYTAPMERVSQQISPHDFLAIAAEHARRVEAAARLANRILFLDTEALTTAVWSEWYLGSCEDVLWQRVDRQTHDLHLLLRPDLPWEDDGTREFPERRRRHFDRLKEELDRRRWPYVIIGGEGDARTHRAVEAVLRVWPDLRSQVHSLSAD
jgi:HTH-type transcriptional regulator, transcriptional repressor of NAD biosynthesis genes